MNKDLTVGNPENVLWKFCIPLFGSIIFQQLYNIADSWVAGKFIGENALAAVGNSYEITLIFIAFAFGCNIGCSVITARFFGSKEYGNVKTSVYTSMVTSAAICLILMFIGIFAGGALLHAIGTPGKIYDDSKLYLDIYVYGLPFVFFYFYYAEFFKKNAIFCEKPNIKSAPRQAKPGAGLILRRAHRCIYYHLISQTYTIC